MYYEYHPQSAVLDSNGMMKIDFTTPNPTRQNYISYRFIPFGKYKNGIVDKLFTIEMHAPNNWGHINFVESLPEEIDVYQVIKNPMLYYPSNIVDLVAGKNADIYLKTNHGINKNLLSATLKWKSHTGNVIKTYSPVSTTTDAEGRLHFEINPVPDENNYVGQPTEIEIETQFLSDCQNAPLVNTYKKQVLIRKTKPLKLGYVKIKSRNNYYADPDSVEYADQIAKGSKYINLIYPIAEGQVATVDSKRYMKGNDDLQNRGLSNLRFDRDAASLLKGYKKYETIKSANRVFGVASTGYFSWNNNSNIWGYSSSEKIGILLSSFAPYEVSAHELTHTYCIRYDVKSGCNDMNNVNAHAQANASLTGYSNENYSILGGYARGLLENKVNLMQPETNTVDMYNMWFDRKEYLDLFRKFLKTPINKSFQGSYQSLVISGIINESTNQYSSDGLYITDEGAGFENNPSGQYLIEVYDLSGSVQFFGKFNPQLSLHVSNEPIKSVDLNIPYQSSFFKAKIFKLDQNNNRTELAAYQIPTEIIKKSASYLADATITGDVQNTRTTLNTKVQQYESIVESKNFFQAKNFLSSDLLPYIQSNIKADFASEYFLEFSQVDLFNALMASQISLDQIQMSSTNSLTNQLLEVVLKNQPTLNNRLSVGLKSLKASENPNVLMVSEFYFDSQRLCYDEIAICNNKNLESFVLNSGNHSLVAKVYLADKKTWRSLTSTITLYQAKLQKLWTDLSNEPDPVKQSVINQNIAKTEGYINSLNMQKEMMKIKIGADIIYNFGVN